MRTAERDDYVGLRAFARAASQAWTSAATYAFRPADNLIAAGKLPARSSRQSVLRDNDVISITFRAEMVRIIRDQEPPPIRKNGSLAEPAGASVSSLFLQRRSSLRAMVAPEVHSAYRVPCNLQDFV